MAGKLPAIKAVQGTVKLLISWNHDALPLTQNPLQMRLTPIYISIEGHVSYLSQTVTQLGLCSSQQALLVPAFSELC